MADTMFMSHLVSRDEAAAALEREHDLLCRIVMTTTDLIGDVQEGRDRLNLPALRRAAGPTLRRSLSIREAALAVLSDRPRVKD